MRGTTGAPVLLRRAVRRAGQWQKSLRPRITPADRAFVATVLTPIEEHLFYQMSPVDQRHCLDVTYDLLESLGLAGAGANELRLRAAQTRPGARTALGARAAELVLAATVEPELMLKAGLLHDIGKGGARISLLARVSFALFPYRALERKVPWRRLRRELEVLSQHAHRGAWTARTFGLGENLARVIECHHDPTASSPEARLLMAADEKN